MAIDFPNSPASGDLYTAGGKTWQWNGTYWSAYGTGPVLRTSDTPPASPNAGDQWYETDTGRMFVYYGTAWVELGNATDVAGALQPSQVTALSAVTSLTSDDVFPVVDGPSGAVASSKITYGNLVTNMSSSLAFGLVLIKTQTVGTAVSSVTVTGAFSADYDNYLIVDSGGNMSSDVPIRLTFGSSATGYYWALIYASFLGGAVNLDPGNNAAFWNYAGGSGTRNGFIEVNNPFLATNTELRSRVRYSTVYGTNVGIHAVASSFTSFTLTASSGTMTGGTIRVYGYRNL